ncbi:UDP-N-acetylglucosamine 2-epimerase (non-hydrolyzing) [Thiohalocapsa marina]|uniref:UDP-N-acetylglucosamine 2-epimerase (Non-hydrolyzing) n=1 Tax=Thiohalocapsa marina TaxID=424902 RepID=A0A5M8FIQ3_9GAMM|nr:UDP-N-acetylglucosamine 2-epimerase (non-hydrolyzing) [Thiohalocapsa marina]KAA6184823.1 UDP-N-acetylglucosamine 2-epimerase (non-hydrolyzing) [Thiohalocapsa marina]
MKLLTILGARPQFIKAATVSRAIQARDDIDEIIVHTGQHFDANMSEVFFDQLDIPRPQHNLGIAGLSHGAMTGRMLEGIEALIQQERPDWVLVYGDTNSTLAGALAASKLHVPVAHVEAGLRSHNPAMPEEINRVLTDRVSTLLLCPTATAVRNLQQEGFPFPAATGAGKHQPQRIENVGDVMLDAVRYYRDLALERVRLQDYGLQHQGYALCTLHRQENTDRPARLKGILSALRQISRDLPVVLPLHPRTHAKLAAQDNEQALEGLTLLDPLPYLEMQRLLMSAKVILTDSGGMQKEAYFHQVPCITLRDETEWVETVDSGWNRLVGADKERIMAAFANAGQPNQQQAGIYGDGQASLSILQQLDA